MTLITTQQQLNTLCDTLTKEPFFAIDTEFIREKYYYPQLCLIQVSNGKTAHAIDPLISQIDLTPFFKLLTNNNIVKVFHAAMQDLEILSHQAGTMPENIFDTQIAAMALGYGEAISYAKLVELLTDGTIDKTHQFTNWEKRPLSKEQLDYALSDVTYLHEMYPLLKENLDEKKRQAWIQEELDHLTNPSTYQANIEKLSRKFTNPRIKPQAMAIAKQLIAWREETAEKRNKPRGHILKDHDLEKIAMAAPTTSKAFQQLRHMPRIPQQWITEILEIVSNIKALPKEELPKLPKNTKKLNDIPLTHLLKVLLKAICDEHHVAEKLIASAKDLALLAHEEKPDIKCLTGWRYELFGKHAIALKTGKIALTSEKDSIKIITI